MGRNHGRRIKHLGGSMTTSTAVEIPDQTEVVETVTLVKDDFLNDLEFLADKAIKYARSKSSLNTHQRINQIRQKYGMDKRLL